MPSRKSTVSPSSRHNVRSGGKFVQQAKAPIQVGAGNVAGSLYRGHAADNSGSGDVWSNDVLFGERRGLSPIVDVLRGLGDESAGLRAREPRLLLDSEITAMMRDGISRRVASLKVEQALAAGHTIDVVGLDPTIAQRLIKEATATFRRLRGREHVRSCAINAEAYGKAIITSAFKSDAGVSDLYRPLRDVVWDSVRWVSVWDRRDYRVRALASSTTPQYRQGSGATWLDLYPYQPELEYDRQYGTHVGLSADPVNTQVHPTRYVQLCTQTGFSVFQECAVYIANLLAATAGGASLMQRAGACVMEMEDWETQALAGGTMARDKLQAQLAALSSANVLITAAGEKATWPNLSISGIDGGIYAMGYLLSAARGIPMPLLLGTSPGQLFSGGEQLKQWHQELDNTRQWLEPALRFVWDLCISEVTGGHMAQYEIVWSPYETPAPAVALETKSKALALGLLALEKGLLSREGVLAGLSGTGALEFDFAAALAAAVAETEIVEPIVAAAATDEESPVAQGKRAPPVPGEAMTIDDIETEPWLPAGEVGEHYALSPSSLASLRTDIPGVWPESGRIAWLKNPKSGHVRYRKVDLARAMLGITAGDTIPPTLGEKQ